MADFGLPQRTLSDIRAIFADYSRVKKVIIYGSRAMGNYKKASDIDLTMLGDKLTYDDLSAISGTLEESSIPYLVDLSIFDYLDHAKLRDHIERVGKVFYEKPIWEKVKLGEVLRTGAGGTPLKSKKEFYDGGNIRWLLSGAVCEKEIYSSETFITQAGLENSSAKIFPPNTVLVAMYGATAGQVGILKVEACTNQAVCGIYPSEKYLPEFLYYFLLSYKEKLLEEASGVAQPNLSQIKIKNIPLPIISRAEQQRIVAKLDAAFAGIDAANNAVKRKQENYHALKSALLAQELQSEAA